MKRVLIITYYWPPSGGSGVQRWLKFTKYLPEFGWTPIVLTVDENYASYPQTDKSLLNDISSETEIHKTKTFEILSLYKKVSSEKQLPYGGFNDTGKLSFTKKLSRFIRGNFFLPDPRRGWNRYAYKKACELIENNKIDAIITTSPPHSTQLIGKKLKNKYPQIKWIADFRDPWTDIHYYKKLYPTKIAHSINKHFEKVILKQADKIIVTCEATKEVFAKKINFDIRPKIDVITNGFDSEDFVDLKSPNTEKFTITYIGILYNDTDIKGFLSAYKSLDKKDDTLLRFVGHSGAVIQKEIENEMLQDFTAIIPEVKHQDAIQLMSDSSLLVLLIPDNEEDSSFIPGKLFEYLAARRPILCLAPHQSDVREIIAECQAGESFYYSEEDKMKAYLTHLIDKWKTDKSLALTNNFYTKYSRKKLTQKLSEILDKTMNN